MLWRGNLGSMNVVARQLWSTKKGCRRAKQMGKFEMTIMQKSVNTAIF